MPLKLAGPVPVPIPASIEDQLLETRVTDFRFDLLERRFTDSGQPIPESVVGTVQGVLGGSLSWTYNQSVKGGGSLSVHDVGQDISWVTARIRPIAILNDETEVPLGVFIPAAPKRQHTATQTLIPIELLDKCYLLDSDVYADLATGLALPYSLAKGSDVLVAVKNLITDIGEATPLIPGDAGILSTSDLTWDGGTTRLKIINDLLSSINYFSLWCDGMGQFRVTKYTRPEDRPAQHTLLAPFEDGRLMTPDWEEEEDIYSIPNRFVAIVEGDEEKKGLMSTAMLPSSSPYSYAKRGRWVTATETGVEAVNQTSLDNYAAWRLAVAVSVSKRLMVTHPFIPNLRVNENIFFRNPGGTKLLCSVYKTSIVLDPLGLSTSELGEAEKVIEDPEMDKPIDPPEEELPDES